MPELPEVETVRCGLIPAMENARFLKVELRRHALRYPFPENFSARLVGAEVRQMTRRGKYLVAHLSTDESLIMHLGMSGRFAVESVTLGEYVHQVAGERHVHAIFELTGGELGSSCVSYADPRRFGFMDLVPTAEVEACRHFAGMGPEPLCEEFSAATLAARLCRKSAPLKSALLDQRVVAGLGNIYVCEALWRAGLSPRRKASTVGMGRAVRLVTAIQDILNDAIAVGGSSLKDHAATDGTMGMFQHRFDVYDRAGMDCHQCGSPIRRIEQSGRSTYFCGKCQR